MNNLIEILPNIYGVKVPSDDKEYYLSGTYFLCRRNKETKRNREVVIDEQLIDFKILGFLTKDEISFDASDVVNGNGDCFFKDYEIDEFKDITSEQSFRSALPEEIYFENPFKEPSCDCYTEYDRDGCPDKCYQWINANNGITQKLLILTKI